MEAVAVQHVEDEEHFQKTQLVDQNNFEDHLDSLQVSWTNWVVFLFFYNSNFIIIICSHELSSHDLSIISKTIL